MFYRVKNWQHYQNADVAKKSRGGLPWVKLWTREDYELQKQPYSVRLLFIEMLKLAGVEMNAIPGDLEWLSTKTSMAAEDVSEGLDALVKGGWLSQTKSNRRSRNDSRNDSREQSRPTREDKRRINRERAERWVKTAGWQFEDVDMLGFLTDELGIKDASDLTDLHSLGQQVRRAKSLEQQDDGVVTPIDERRSNAA